MAPHSHQSKGSLYIISKATFSTLSAFFYCSDLTPILSPALSLCSSLAPAYRTTCNSAKPPCFYPWSLAHAGTFALCLPVPWWVTTTSSRHSVIEYTQKLQRITPFICMGQKWYLPQVLDPEGLNPTFWTQQKTPL